MILSLVKENEELKAAPSQAIHNSSTDHPKAPAGSIIDSFFGGGGGSTDGLTTCAAKLN
jgi:hypothetical protein